MPLSLTASQKTVCERVINVFETGSERGDYSCISIFHDGPKEIRQITYGRSQTTEYGNLAELVSMYASAGGTFSADLAPYAAMVGKKPLVDNAAFKALLVRAGREDPVMQETQDRFFDQRYFAPALKWAEEHGFTLPLSALVIYDSFVHSGGILPFLQNAFPEKVPSAGGDERLWITAYVKARQHWLASNARTILHATVYRTQCFLTEIARGNWDLSQLPIFAHGVRVDDKPFAPVSHPVTPPPAPQPSNPAPKESAMTIAASPVLASPTPAIAANPVVAAAVQSSTISLSNVWSSVTGIFSSVTMGGIFGALSMFAPSLVAEVLLLIGIAGSIVSAIAHGYALIFHVKATNNATISMVENLLTEAEAAFGGKPMVFQNDPTPLT